MQRFSIGFNGSLAFMDAIEKYRDHVAEVYFVAPAMASGRASGGRLGAQSYTLALHQMLVRAKEWGLPTNILFNALCVGSDYGSNRQGEKVVSILQIHGELYNVRAATVVSPIDAQLIKRALPDATVHASVNMFIRNPVQAREVAPFCDVLTLDRNVNRDLEMVRKIKEATGKPIRLVANEACVPECMNRVQHFNHLSHQQSVGVSYYLPCVRQFQEDPATLLKCPIIRPEDVHRYDGLVDGIRLASRIAGDMRIDLMLRAYTTGRFDGNLFDLMESGGLESYICILRKRDGLDPYMDNAQIPPDFHEHVTQCDKLCGDCTYCEQVASKAFRTVPYKKAEAVG